MNNIKKLLGIALFVSVFCHNSGLSTEEKRFAVTSHDKAAGAFLGVTGKDFDSTIAVELGSKNGGALVNGIVENSPAEKYGIKISDIIIKCDTTNIYNFSRFIGYVSGKKAGDTVNVTLLRQGKENNIRVVLGSVPPGHLQVHYDRIFKDGRKWEYKVLFINNNKDTTMTKTISATAISLENLKLRYNKTGEDDSSEGISSATLYLEWAYGTPPTLQAYPVIEAGAINTLGPRMLDLSFLKFAPSPWVNIPINQGQEWNRLTFEIDYSLFPELLKKGTKLQPWETQPVEHISCLPLTPEGTIKEKHTQNWKNQYYKVLEQKEVKTLLMNFKNCWEIDSKAESKEGTYKAVFYLNEKYGFVRWEYTKPDSSQVILDLEKVSGFDKTITGELDEKAAIKLAVDLANKECERIYKEQPFLPEHYKLEFSDGRWKWGFLDPMGVKGYSAKVSFNKDGSGKEIQVFLSTDSNLRQKVPVEKATQKSKNNN